MAIRSSDVGETVATDPTVGETVATDPTVGDGLDLVVEDELELTPDAAAILARIVRQHLDRGHAPPGLRLVCHTAAPH